MVERWRDLGIGAGWLELFVEELGVLAFLYLAPFSLFVPGTIISFGDRLTQSVPKPFAKYSIH